MKWFDGIIYVVHNNMCYIQYHILSNRIQFIFTDMLIDAYRYTHFFIYFLCFLISFLSFHILCALLLAFYVFFKCFMFFKISFICFWNKSFRMMYFFLWKRCFLALDFRISKLSILKFDRFFAILFFKFCFALLDLKFKS